MAEERSRRPTSKDVSKLAGVSQATVSRAFTNETMLSEETRKKVMDAAKQLGYIPNYIARSMVSSKTDLIGIVVFHNESPFQHSLITLLAREIRRRGHYPVLVYQNADESPEDTISNALMYRVDGIFITEAENSDRILELCASASVPVVLVSRNISGAKLTSVGCDDYSAGAVAADYLHKMGHRSVACLAGSQDASTTQKRIDGFLSRAKTNQMRIESVLYGDYSYQSGCRLAEKIMSQTGKPVDALFCTGDILALGAIDTLRQKFALSVPEDVSVMGVDNIPEAEWLSYSLTTMAQPMEKMAESACDSLIRLIDNPGEPREQRVFSCNLLVRKSVKRKTERFGE